MQLLRWELPDGVVHKLPWLTELNESTSLLASEIKIMIEMLLNVEHR